MKAPKIAALISTAILSTLVGCTGRSTSTEVIDTTDTQTPIYDTSSNGQIFDSGSGTGNLFDTDMSSDTTPSTSSSQAQSIANSSVPTSVLGCTSSNSGITFDQNGYATSNSSSASACYDTMGTQSSNGWSASMDSYYKQSVNDLTYMSKCFHIVKAAKPTIDKSLTLEAQSEQLRIAYGVAKMALTRCARHIVRSEQYSRPWNNGIAQNYGAIDRTLYDLQAQFYNNGTFQYGTY